MSLTRTQIWITLLVYSLFALGTFSGILLDYATGWKVLLFTITCGITIFLFIALLQFASKSGGFLSNQKAESMINEFSIKQSLARDEEEKKQQLQEKIDKFISNNSLKLSKKEHYELFIRKLCMDIEAVQGAFFLTQKKDHLKYITLVGSFAYTIPESQTIQFEFGEGIAGTAAKEGRTVLLSDLPEGYLTVISGLGKSSPRHLYIVPILNEKSETKALLEIASFKEFSDSDQKFIQSIVSKIILE